MEIEIRVKWAWKVVKRSNTSYSSGSEKQHKFLGITEESTAV